MHKDYKRKVIVITGATTGIGRTVAQMFADKGHKVFSLSRKKVEDKKIRFIEFDITNSEKV